MKTLNESYCGCLKEIKDSIDENQYLMVDFIVHCQNEVKTREDWVHYIHNGKNI